MNLERELTKHFSGQKRVKLGKLVEKCPYGEHIPVGTLVLFASSDRKIRFRILEKRARHRGWSEPLALNDEAKKLKITANYLLWYVSHDFVREALAKETQGTVILRVPRKALHSLPVPIPKRVIRKPVEPEIVIPAKNGGLIRLIGDFYQDYSFNLESGRFRTAIILAGAIAEMIVYQALIDEEVDPQILQEDRNLGLGKMLDYLRILKLENEVPYTHLREIQKKRNSAVHAGSLAKDPIEFDRLDLSCFDHVVRHFGI